MIGKARGRPKKAERLVMINVMVAPEVKQYLQKAAEVQQMTMSQKVREILNWYWETR